MAFGINSSYRYLASNVVGTVYQHNTSLIWKTTPDIDNNSVKVEVTANTTSADKVEVKYSMVKTL